MLAHPDVGLRYWSIWGLALMRSRAAIRRLEALRDSDERVYDGWWSVGEEASDALATIRGEEVTDREPLAQRLGQR